MGKKSRRKTKGKQISPVLTNNNNLENLAFSALTIASDVSSSFANPLPNEPTPEFGWAREYGNAGRELKATPEDSSVVLRAAKAARMMRQFDKLSNIIEYAYSKEMTFADIKELLLC